MSYKYGVDSTQRRETEMKRTNILWLALIALVLYIAMNNRSTAQVQPARQGPSNIRVHEVTDGLRQGLNSAVQVSGRIVGFSCVETTRGGVPTSVPTRCYVATTD